MPTTPCLTSPVFPNRCLATASSGRKKQNKTKQKLQLEGRRLNQTPPGTPVCACNTSALRLSILNSSLSLRQTPGNNEGLLHLFLFLFSEMKFYFSTRASHFFLLQTICGGGVWGDRSVPTGIQKPPETELKGAEEGRRALVGELRSPILLSFLSFARRLIGSRP